MLSITLGVLVLVLTSVLASLVDLDPSDLNNSSVKGALLGERAVYPCASCVTPCNPWIGVCAAPCGPFANDFEPPGCGVCLSQTKAPAQCLTCVKKCEAVSGLKNPANFMFASCIGQEFKNNACIRIREPSLGENGAPGICTIEPFAKDGSIGPGVYCSPGTICDVAVAATTTCQQGGQVGPPPPPPPKSSPKPATTPPSKSQGTNFGLFLENLLQGSSEQIAVFTGAAGKKRDEVSDSASSENPVDWGSEINSGDEEIQITTSPSSDHKLRSLHSRSVPLLAEASFLNRTSGLGYRFVIPTDTCINTNIGTFTEPGTGIVHTDATTGDYFRLSFYAHLRGPDPWRQHTRTQALALLVLVDSLVSDTGTCHPSPASEGELRLKERADNSSSTGLIKTIENNWPSVLVKSFWMVLLLAERNVYSVGVTTLDLTITRLVDRGFATAQGNGTVTTIRDDRINEMVGLMYILVPAVLARVDLGAQMTIFEAVLLNFFLHLMRNIVTVAKACFTSQAVKTATENFAHTEAASTSSIPVFGPLQQSPNPRLSPYGPAAVELDAWCPA